MVDVDRAQRRARVTIWNHTSRGTMAIGQLVSGDTLILLCAKRIQDDTHAWDIITKGMVGHILVDSEIRQVLKFLC